MRRQPRRAILVLLISAVAALCGCVDSRTTPHSDGAAWVTEPLYQRHELGTPLFLSW